MVKLKRVYESAGHIERLKTLLKFYSNNPTNWDQEWSVNPYFMVDLKKYGEGNCVCGHPIRYQFQFLNKVNGRTFPVGSVCVNLLHLSQFSDAIDKLERINAMANQDLDSSLDSETFVKTYKKVFNPESLDALLSYNNQDISPSLLKFYKDNYSKRKLNEYKADRMREVIEKAYSGAKKLNANIERKSKPVTPDQVQHILSDSEKEMERLANAKQKTLPFF